MSPNEFAREMARLAQRYHNEPEVLRREARNFLLSCMCSLGFKDGVDLYNKIENFALAAQAVEEGR